MLVVRRWGSGGGGGGYILSRLTPHLHQLLHEIRSYWVFYILNV